jgi:uncharacterized repeat protein (TIGR01451 family)
MHIRQHSSKLFIGALLAVSNHLVAAPLASQFLINNHETLGSISFIARATKPGANQPPQPITASFQAFGKRFNLELLPNEQLFANLPLAQKQQLQQSLHIYKGQLANTPGSWLRLNQQGTRFSGVVWDGKELYLIDRSDKVAAALGKQAHKKTAYQLIYKLSDTQSTGSCAVTGTGKQAIHPFKALVKELQGHMVGLAQAPRKLDTAIVTDTSFNQANPNPQNAVIETMNVVDGIFSEQVKVNINVSEIRNLTNNGSLTSNDAVTLLQQFSNYVNAPSFKNPGLAHLLTNRNMMGNVIGIAYVRALCNKAFGVGLSQTNGAGVNGALVTAHEIGHNFGAPHDDEIGSTCASTPGTFLMNPFINGSKQFSTCSLQQMQPSVSGAACITANANSIPVDIRPVIPVNPISIRVSTNFNYQVQIRNDGNSPANNATVRVTIPASLKFRSARANGTGQCSFSAGAVNCNLGMVLANSTRILNIALTSANTPANLLSGVKATASNDSVSTNNTTKVSIKVKPL